MPLYVSPGSALRFWRMSVEQVDPTLLQLVDELVRENMVVWDVGANVGLFSFAAAHRVGAQGSVLAIEPNTFLVDLLRRSSRFLATNRPERQARVVVLPVAIAHEVGISEFHIAVRGNSTSYITGTGSTQTGGMREVHHVPTVSLDWLLGRYNAPDLVKIDVEGAEMLALQGAHRLLTNVRPIIICEIAGEYSSAAAACFHQYGYRLFDGNEIGMRHEVAHAVWNTLAIPS